MSGRLLPHLRRTPIRLAVAALLVVEVYPLLWLLLSSLKQEDESSRKPIWALPEGLDLLLSLTFISDDELRTVQTGLLKFVGQYGQRQWGPTFASVCLTVVPILLLYLVLNQKVMKGLTAGSVKG